MSDYLDIKQQARRRANFNDIDTYYDDCILFAENRIYLEARVPEMVGDWVDVFSSPVAGEEGAYDLPSDYIETRALTIEGKRATQLSLAAFEHRAASSAQWNQGSPFICTVHNYQIFIRPTPTVGPIRLYYYSAFPSMTVSGQESNAMATRYPELFTFAVLVELMDIYEDDRYQLYESRYQQALARINAVGLTHGDDTGLPNSG